MNSIDIVIVILIALFAVLGSYWGLIRQTLSLVGLATGIIVAGRYGAVVGDAFSSFVMNDSLAQVLGFIVVLITVTALISLVASLIRRFAGLLVHERVDQVAGAVLGVVAAGMICAALLIAAATYPNEWWTPVISQSQLAAPLVRLYSMVLATLPPTFSFAARMMFGTQ